MRLLSLLAAVLVLSGCAIVGEVQTTTVKVQDGTAEVRTHRAGGAIACGPAEPGAPPCRTGQP